jgi:hypothetical protein
MMPLIFLPGPPKPSTASLRAGQLFIGRSQGTLERPAAVAEADVEMPRRVIEEKAGHNDPLPAADAAGFVESYGREL